MLRKLCVCLIPLSIVLLAAEESWKTKKVADWTESDAKQVLTDSPWVKSVVPKISKSGGSGGGRGGRGGMGGGGMGGPRIGGGRRGGMGYPGGGYPGGGYPYPGGTGRYPGGSGGQGGGGQRGGGGGKANRGPKAVTLRWESALPVQEALLKSKDANAPTVDEGHYSIAVYGVPKRMIGDDAKKLKAEIKLDGKKKIKSTDARVISRDDGPVVVFQFDRKNEITANNKDAEFSTKIGQMELNESFELTEMKFDGKLAL